MPYNPDTPANRALLRAVRAHDASATSEALARGADPNAAWGRGKGSSFTCSALMRAVDFQDQRPGMAEVVGLLLGAGAHPWSSPHAQGRSPLESVMRKGHDGILAVFVNHAGGQDAFLAQAQSSRQGYRVLGALLDSGLSKPLARELFFKALDRIPSPLWPSGAGGGVPWPWDRLPGVRVDGATVARIERRSPRPTLETLGKDGWIKWLRSTCLFADKNELFRQLCRSTPAPWWLEKLPPLGQGPDVCGFNLCLLTVLAKNHCQEGLRIALATIAKNEETQARLKEMAPALLTAAAGAGSAPIFRQFLSATGKADLSVDEASRLALVVSQNSYDPHHRLSLFQLLLDVGVDLESRRSPGSPTLLDQVLNWPERQSRALIDHWMEQGLDWSVQDDRGVSRLSKLARVDPERAARWHQAGLETRLEEPATPRKGGWRL